MSGNRNVNHGVLLFAILLIVLFLLLVYLVLSAYSRNKKKLNEKNEIILEEIKRKETESAEKLENDRKTFERMMRIKQAELAAKEKELNDGIAALEREQALREDYSRKSDRDLIIELHVKEERILERLRDLDLEPIQSNTDHIVNIANGIRSTADQIKETVDDVKNELGNFDYPFTNLCDTVDSISSAVDGVQEIVGRIDSNVDEQISSVSWTLKEAITSNASGLTEDEIERAVSNVLDSRSAG